MRYVSLLNLVLAVEAGRSSSDGAMLLGGISGLR